MFSYLGRSRSCTTAFADEEREAFLTTYKTTLCKLYGIVQKEYVMVPDALLKRTRELKRFFDASHAYVSSLKPKPTKKRRA